MRKSVAWILLLLVGVAPAVAQSVFTVAENKVPVALVAVARSDAATVVRLQAQTALNRVCWTDQGDNSPYLLAGGQRYRFLGGDNITSCPNRRDYAQNEVMVLRFQPLRAQAGEMSLVEGRGGENQMIDPASQPGIRYWNFLHIKLR